MISARLLFKDTIRLVVRHPSLLLYGALVYLPFIVSLWFMLLFVFALSSIVVGPIAALFLIWPLIFFGFPIFFILCGFGFTIYLQAILNHRRVSFLKSFSLVYDRVKRAWWILPLYFLVYFFYWVSPLNVIVAIVLMFVKQLVNDGHTGFSDCMNRSWDLFKQTGGVLVRFFIMLVGAVLLLLLLTMLSFLQAFFVQGAILSWATYFFLATGTALSLFLVTSFSVLCTCAVNLVYHEYTR